MPFFTAPQGTNVVDYSHSSVFTTSYPTPPPTLSNLAVPLTTIYTPLSSCSNRWMLNMTQDAIDAPLTIAFSRSLSDALDDPEYVTCQPFAQAPTYSPGVCPDGHTLAEVTEHQVSKTAGGMDRYWQASCCKSGLGFGPATKGLCYSSVTAPLPVQEVIGGVEKENGRSVSAYEFNNEGSTVKNMGIMTTGLAIADPVIVGWQIQDLQSFPSAYASSLAQRIGISTPTPSPGSASTVPSSTNEPAAAETGPSIPASTPSGLSTGAKIGISVGVVANVAILGAILAFVLIKRSKKKKESGSPHGTTQVHEMPGGGGEKTDMTFYGGHWSSPTSPISPTQELQADKDAHEIGLGKEVRRKGSELDSKAVHILSATPIELDASNHAYIARTEKSTIGRAEKQII